MKKKLIGIVVLLLLACVGWLVVKTIQTQKHKKLVADKIQQLPEFALETMQGSFFTRDSVTENLPLVVIHFSPGCEHCQYEAKEIEKNKDKLKDVMKLMVTKDTSNATADFIKQYQLHTVPRLWILKDRDNQLYKTFGLSAVPSFLIYNKEHQLVKKVDGEAKIDYLLQHIQ
jgi:cytochrome oxidase Cu insertion factor (SCO1/SenC/PrrC family)